MVYLMARETSTGAFRRRVENKGLGEPLVQFSRFQVSTYPNDPGRRIARRFFIYSRAF